MPPMPPTTPNPLNSQVPQPEQPPFPGGQGEPQPPPGKQWTLQDYQIMERKARNVGDWPWVRYFQAKQRQLSPGTRENVAATPTQEPEESRGDLEYILGAGIEPNLSMLSGALVQPLAGYMGMAKGGLINPLMRATGGKPADAAELVRAIQDWQYQPRSRGGKAAIESMGIPFEWWSKKAEGEGERQLREGKGPLAATTAETLMQAVPQVLGGEALGRVGRMPMPLRQGTANLAGRIPGVGENIKRAVQRTPPVPEIQMLLDKGIVPTIGGRANVSESPLKKFFMGRGEEWLTRMPFFGAYTIAGRERPVGEHAWVQLNDARTPVGLEPIKQGTKSMHDAIADTEEDLGEKYEDYLGRVNANAYTDSYFDHSTGQPSNFAKDLSQGLTWAAQGNPDLDLLPLQSKQRMRLKSLMTYIVSHFSKQQRLPDGSWSSGGELTGKQLKKIATRLREEKSKIRRSNSPEDADLVPYIDLYQDAVKNLVRRADPVVAEQMKTLDLAWAQLKAVMDASTQGGVAGKMGFFSPSQMERSIKKQTKRRLGEERGTAMIAKGEVQGLKLAQAAGRVLGNRVPNSGTTESLLAASEAVSDAIPTIASGDPSGLNKWFIGLLGGLAQKPYYSRWMQDWLARGSQRPEGTGIGAQISATLPGTLNAAQSGREEMDRAMQEELQKLLNFGPSTYPEELGGPPSHPDAPVSPHPGPQP